MTRRFRSYHSADVPPLAALTAAAAATTVQAMFADYDAPSSDDEQPPAQCRGVVPQPLIKDLPALGLTSPVLAPAQTQHASSALERLVAGLPGQQDRQPQTPTQTAAEQTGGIAFKVVPGKLQLQRPATRSRLPAEGQATGADVGKPRLLLQQVGRSGTDVIPGAAGYGARPSGLQQQEGSSLFGALFSDLLQQQAAPEPVSAVGAAASEPWLHLMAQQQMQQQAPREPAAMEEALAFSLEHLPVARDAVGREAGEVLEVDVEIAAGSGRRFSLQRSQQHQQQHLWQQQHQQLALQPAAGSTLQHPAQPQQQQQQHPQAQERPPLLLASINGQMQHQQQQQQRDIEGQRQPPAPAQACEGGPGVQQPPAAAVQRPTCRPQQHALPRVAPGEAEEADRQGPALSGSQGEQAGGVGPGSAADAAPLSPASLDLDDYLAGDLADAMREACRMTDLYPWQAECLSLPGVLQADGPGCNLVFQAPTGSGKSNVACVLMLRALRLDPARKAMLVLPLRRACQEQADMLVPMVAKLNREVKHAYGGHYDHALLGPSTGVLVCTAESANSLLNRMLDAGVAVAHEFSIFVMDEVHMLQDDHRGTTYELLLAKLRYVQKRAEDEACKEQQEVQGKQQQQEGSTRAAADGKPRLAASERVQLVCMSATLPGPKAFARCLAARSYMTSYRPIQLDHFLVSGQIGQQEAKAVFDSSGAVVRHIKPLPARNNRTDPIGIGRLCQEAVDGSHQVLVFCATKKTCAAEARLLAALLLIPEPAAPSAGLPTGGKQSVRGASSPVAAPYRQRFAATLREAGDFHSVALAALIEKGVAYHHSDVSSTAKELVLQAYRCGAVAVLCATPTLSSSVNLTTARCIFRHAYVRSREPDCWLSPQSYHQMSGRAGRKGLEVVGESFLVHDVREPPPRSYLESLLRSGVMQSVHSRLLNDQQNNEGLRAAMLDAVAGCGARTKEDVARYVHHCTIAAASTSSSNLPALVEAARGALRWLGNPDGKKELALVSYDRETHEYRPTALGRAAFASALPVDEALAIHADIDRLSRRLNLQCDLPFCFLSVPPHNTQDMQADHWLHLLPTLERESLDENTREVLAGIGISLESPALAFVRRRHQEAAAVRNSHNHNMTAPASEEDRRLCRLCSRLYTALALQELIKEVPEREVGERYHLTHFRDLKEACSFFAGRAAAFANRRGWTLMAAVLKQFQTHILYGSKLEIVPLTELKGVDVATARLLHNAGLCTLEAVAEADLQSIIAALSNAVDPRNVDPEKVAARRRREAKRIKKAAAEKQEDPLRGVRRGGEGRGKKRLRAITAFVKGQRLMAAQEGSEEELESGSEEEQAEEEEGEEEEEEADEDEGEEDEEGRQLQGQQAAVQQQQQPQEQHLEHAAEAAQPQQVQQQQQQATEDGALRGASRRRRLDLDAADREEVDAPVPGLPGPGLHIVAGVQEAQHLCQQLQNAAINCIGFSLHIAPGSRLAVDVLEQEALPPPPRDRKRKRGQPDSQLPPGLLLGVALSWANGAAAYIPLCTAASSSDSAASRLETGADSEIAALLFGSACPQQGHCEEAGSTTDVRAARDTRFVVSVALQQQVPALKQLAPAQCRVMLPPQVVDVRLAAWLLYPESKRLQALMAIDQLRAVQLTLDKLTGGTAAFDAACAGLPAAAPDLQQQHQLVPGWLDACRTAAASAAAWRLIRSQLEAVDGLLPVLLEQEMPLVVVLARMEAVGVGVDVKHLTKLKNQLDLRIKQIGYEIESLLGHKLDLHKHAKVSHVLYNQLKLIPTPGAQRLKSGGWSSRKEVLELMMRRDPGCHPILRLIVESRKAESTRDFVQKLLTCARGGTIRAAALDAASAEAGGRLRLVPGSHVPGRAGYGPRMFTILHQSNSDTGRLAEEDPSLQCTPNAHQLNLQAGPVEISARRGLVAAPGCVLLSADCRQLELRVLAHFSKDEELLAALEDGKEDPFCLLAARWSKEGIEPGQVTDEEREHTKHIVYGLMYGMGSSRLGEEMDLSAKDASNRRQEFLNSFPRLKALLEALVQDCQAKGYVETIAGRRSYLHGIHSTEWRRRSEAERKAVNTPMQGSAADLAKQAMICVHERLSELGEGAFEMCIMIHDELVIELQQDKLTQVAALVRECMEVTAPQRLGLTVPLRVALSCGPTWGDLEDFDAPVVPQPADRVE